MSADLLGLLAIFVVSGGGAWFASYLREKGKNYATKEDVQTLTRLTEEVRADISGKMWLDQKRWDLKRDFYWELLASLNETSNGLRDFQALFNFKLEDMKPEELLKFKERLTHLTQQLQQKQDTLNRIVGVGRIILPDAVVGLLDSFQEKLRQLEKQATEAMSQYALPGSKTEKMAPEELEAYLSKTKDFPEKTRQIIEVFRREHSDVMPAIIRAARHDLLSL